MHKDVTDRWEILNPVVLHLHDQIMNLSAGLPKEDWDKLALFVTGHFLGVACAMTRKARPELADKPLSVVGTEIMNEIIPMLDTMMKREMN